MGKINILNYTTKEPLEMIGNMAGICWNAPTNNKKKNVKRAINCLESNHGRTFEFPDVYLLIDEHSAKVIREFYTHIGGAPTRLQESTRYVDYSDFKYITPKSILDCKDALKVYNTVQNYIKEGIVTLLNLGIPNEDATMLLSLGSNTKMVGKYNLRTLMEMSHQRECNRAYWEFRELFNELKNELSNYSKEWKYIVDNYFKPKCKVLGYCPEGSNKSCGLVKGEKPKL